MQWTNRAIFDNEGKIVQYQSVGRDITQQKHVEEALRASEERFRRAVMEAPFPIMIHAEDGEVLRINRVWTDLTGYHPEEIPTIVEWTERAYGERKEFTRARIDKLYRIDGRVAEGDYTITAKDGRTIIWDFSSAALGRTEDGRRLAISMATDVTEQRQAEAQVRKQQEELAHLSRLSTMGEMATGLAHELNQPLTSIVNYAHGCRLRIASNGLRQVEITEALEEIANEARRAGEIIRRIRSFVRKTEPRRSSVALAEVIGQVSEMMRHQMQERGIVVLVETEHDLACIEADKVQMQQVLLNLMQNSLDSIAETQKSGGRITVKATSNGPDLVEVVVQDTGGGLPAGALERIFEPFYTTKPNGTGMGLAISRTIIEAHGGRISASSNSHGGADVRFSLPLVRDGLNGVVATDDTPVSLGSECRAGPAQPKPRTS